MLKIAIVLGTRPEVIKLAPVLRELKKHTRAVKCILIFTGQHREIANQTAEVFSMKADYFLNVMKDNQRLGDLSSRLMVKISRILGKEKPDLLLVQGDTTSAMISTLAAFYKKVKIGHIEAGLRTYEKYNPFPEEVNRRLISVLADLHFAPTKNAYDNLIKEGIDKRKIFITGNTIVDSLLKILREIRKRDKTAKNNGTKFVVVTIHRRESFGKPITDICEALKELARIRKDIEISIPVHPNPSVKKTILSMLSGIRNIKLTEPIGYNEFIEMIVKADLILTDSGGVVEEAVSLKKPVLILRRFTERPESVASGIAKLIGTDKKKIIKHVCQHLNRRARVPQTGHIKSPFGDGMAAKRISKVILGLNNKSGKIKL